MKKLRNKKTGEIRRLFIEDGVFKVVANDGIFYKQYKSLAKLNEEWEDYEEPKEDGLENIIALIEAYSSNDSERYPKEIVERLKAWKRLKDKGFRFKSWKIDHIRKLGVITIKTEPYYSFEYDDLNLLFSGEDD